MSSSPKVATTMTARNAGSLCHLILPHHLYFTYRCTSCGHAGQLHLMELTAEITTACSACGTEALAEWDGGVEMTTTPP